MYYLDLARVTSGDPGPAIAAMVAYGGPGVLFVIDNIHAAELIAGALYDDWKTRAEGSVLLLSGRRVSADPSSGAGDRLADIRANAVSIRATPEDALGTYHRLSRRLTSDPPVPPRYLPRRCAELFEGDLVAFAAALTGKLRSGDLLPDVSPHDAVEHVRARHLRPHHDDEAAIAALTTVAALGVLEIPAPGASVDTGALAPWLSSGLLLRVQGGITVAHAGLARLLLAAAGRPALDLETLAAFAHVQPQLARGIARRVSERGTRAEHLAFWKAAVATGDWLGLLPDTLADLPPAVRAIRDAIELSWEELDATIAEAVDWNDAAQRTPPERLPAVVGLCGRHLPLCAERLWAALVPDDRPAPWFAEALGQTTSPVRADLGRVITRFHPSLTLDDGLGTDAGAWADRVGTALETQGLTSGLRSQLGRLKRLPPPMLAALDARLAAVTAERWAELIVDRPAAVRQLMRFDLPATRARIEESLASPGLAGAWIATWMQRGPDKLTIAMFDLKKALPDLHAIVGRQLAEQGNADAWAARALSRGEQHLGTARQANRAFGRAIAVSIAVHPAARAFVARADAALADDACAPLLGQAVRVQSAEALGRLVREAPRSWPLLDTRLRAFAEDPDVTAELARELCNAPLSELRLALVDHPLARAVLAAVRPNFWRIGRPVLEATTSYVHFPAVAKGLAMLGRQDLAEALAVPIAEAVIDGRIPRRGINLTHVSHVLRLLPASASGLRGDLVESLTGDWVSKAIEGLPAMDLAQALYSIWCFAPELASVIAEVPLEERVRRDVERGTRNGILRLIGTADLFRPGRLKPPAAVAALATTALEDRPAWRRDGLAPGLAQSLLGLRAIEAAGLASAMPAERLDAFIARCDASALANHRQREIVVGLRDWLAAKVEEPDPTE